MKNSVDIGTENLTTEQIPFRPTGGRVLVRQLPYRPSRILEILDCDKAVENEGVVVALSPHRFGRRLLPKKGWEHNGMEIAHEVKIGDRVFFRGTYQDEDVMRFNGVKYRCLDSWDIVGIMDVPQPTGYEDPKTGEMLPDKHPLLIH